MLLLPCISFSIPRYFKDTDICTSRLSITINLTASSESITMWEKKGTGTWLRTLTPERCAAVTEAARKSVTHQTIQYFERKRIICQQKLRRQTEKVVKEEAWIQKERVHREQLTKDLESVRGLWTSAQEVDARLQGLASEKVLHTALETQLKFRRYVYVLSDKNTNQILSLSAGG